MKFGLDVVLIIKYNFSDPSYYLGQMLKYSPNYSNNNTLCPN